MSEISESFTDPRGAPVIELEPFYEYGYEGDRMFAVRSPFAMEANGLGLLGTTVRIGGQPYKVARIARQLTGPIAKGEPIGIGVVPLSEEAHGR